MGISKLHGGEDWLEKGLWDLKFMYALPVVSCFFKDKVSVSCSQIIILLLYNEVCANAQRTSASLEDHIYYFMPLNLTSLLVLY